MVKYIIVIICILCFSCGSPEEKTILMPDSVDASSRWLKLAGITFVRIPEGEFMMGSPSSEKGHEKDESPLHAEQIYGPLYMSIYEITQRQYLDIMGYNNSKQKNLDNPVENLSWYEAYGFCNKLNSLSSIGVFRLPTEKEWEYCCRGGTQTRFYWGDDTHHEQINKYATYLKNSNYKPGPVGLKRPNDFLLYDMSGNVAEWCDDNYNSYGDGEIKPWKVIRGGNCISPAEHCRSAFRNHGPPDDKYPKMVGFRIVFIPEIKD